MLIREINAEAQDDGGVILHVPIWPVFSLSILKLDTNELLWDILPDTFTSAEATAGNELTFHTVMAEPLEVAAETVPPTGRVAVDIIYGRIPAGMKQTFPRNALPRSLEPGESYMLVLREFWTSDLIRFTFRIAPSEV